MDPSFFQHSTIPGQSNGVIKSQNTNIVICMEVTATAFVYANFLSILYKKKNYIFYFTHSFLQNIYISLSILQIYSIKYSFFYNFLLFSLTAPLSHWPTLSHRPRPNTQRKVVAVFVGMRASLFSSVSGFGSPVIEMARFLDRSSYARLSTEDLGPSSLFCC